MLMILSINMYYGIKELVGINCFTICFALFLRFKSLFILRKI
jgi:hypothetical protein